MLIDVKYDKEVDFFFNRLEKSVHKWLRIQGCSNQIIFISVAQVLRES